MTKLVIIGLLTAISAPLSPVAKFVESSWYWGFEYEIGFGPAKITLLHIPIHIPSGQEAKVAVAETVEAVTGVDLFASWQLTNEEIICSIGASEGTRNKNCNPNKAFYGHDDPGWSGKCQNLGTFSYQHCAASPEEADQKWLPVLRKTENNMQAEAKEKFGTYLSPKAIAAGLDSHTQSPNAATYYLDYLTTADPSFDQILQARIKALNKSRSRLGGPANFNVSADQRRRLNRIWEQIHR